MSHPLSIFVAAAVLFFCLVGAQRHDNATFINITTPNMTLASFPTTMHDPAYDIMRLTIQLFTRLIEDGPINAEWQRWRMKTEARANEKTVRIALHYDDYPPSFWDRIVTHCGTVYKTCELDLYARRYARAEKEYSDYVFERCRDCDDFALFKRMFDLNCRTVSTKDWVGDKQECVELSHQTFAGCTDQCAHSIHFSVPSDQRDYVRIEKE